jgi:hypothetical protein
VRTRFIDTQAASSLTETPRFGAPNRKVSI